MTLTDEANTALEGLASSYAPQVEFAQKVAGMNDEYDFYSLEAGVLEAFLHASRDENGNYLRTEKQGLDDARISDIKKQTYAQFVQHMATRHLNKGGNPLDEGDMAILQSVQDPLLGNAFDVFMQIYFGITEDSWGRTIDKLFESNERLDYTDLQKVLTSQDEKNPGVITKYNKKVAESIQEKYAPALQDDIGATKEFVNQVAEALDLDDQYKLSGDVGDNRAIMTAFYKLLAKMQGIEEQPQRQPQRRNRGRR